MKNFLREHLKSLAIPSLLIGLAMSGLAPKYPIFFKWMGSACLIVLIIITICYVLLWFFNVFTPRRFANSIFAIDSEGNIALILHPHYKRYQPPGSRLGYHEAPHLAVARVMLEELGLEKEKYILVSNEEKLEVYGNNRIVPKPYIVKSEKGKHRLGVIEHYDYVYVCLINKVKENLHSSLEPRWFSLEELEHFSVNDVERTPWGDVIPIFKRILNQTEHLSKYDNFSF